VSRTNPQDTAKADLWLLDLVRGGGATRLTLGTGIAESPVWSPDGKRIIFTFGNSRLRQKLASGEGDEEDMLRVTSAGVVTASGWSRDGQFRLYTAVDTSTTLRDLWVLQRNDLKAVPFLRTAFDESRGRFLPDGRWVAYISNQSGLNEVYVKRFTADFSGGSGSAGGSLLVSRGGGTAPRWRGDGRELSYLAPNGKMMAVEVKLGQEFDAGSPAALFETPIGAIFDDVTADGKRFLLTAPVGPSSSAPFTVLLNWTAGLKK